MANRRDEIKMTTDEVQHFLDEERTVTMCTMHPDGSIHAVAMWYAFLDGVIAIETKAKSQKAQNIRRDPRITFLVEAGQGYNELRGVEVVGQARVVDDPDAIARFGISMYERYVGPYSEDKSPHVAAMMHNRVLITLDVTKVVTWDHRKLGTAAPA